MIEVRNPASGEVLREVATDDRAAVDAKLAAARAAARAWARLPLDARVAAVAEALRYFARERDAVARDVTLEMGKPLAQALREVDGMLGRAEHMLEIAPDALADERPAAAKGLELRIVHEPVGVVLDVAAWNYPLLVPVNVVVPALVAGNALVLKHSPRTPGAGEHFARAFATLPEPDVFAHVVVTDAEAGALVAHPEVDHVSFTGSVATGRGVYRTASERLIGVGLELGGKDPAYVAADADLDFAAENVVDGACYNAGQSCCAVERVYVHASVYDAFLERALAHVRAYRLGDPLAQTTTMGPLVDAAARKRVEEQVTDARRRGARVLAGGGRPQGLGGFFHEPTLLADCPADALAMREETFGPLVPVAAVADDDEALARMNDSRYGLTASVWTRSPERAERFARELVVGTVYQNRCDYLEPALPWTGVKESGLGSTLSRHGYLHLTRCKSLNFRR